MSSLMRKKWTLGSLRAADWHEVMGLKAAAFERIAALAIESGNQASQCSDVSADLTLVGSSPEYAGHPSLTGWAEVTLPVVCQRCLQPMRYELKAYVDAVFVDDELDPAKLPANVDVWSIGTEVVRLLDVVEETLVMSMPLAPRHVQACTSNEYLAGQNEAVSEPMQKPFADLKSLLSDKLKQEKK